MKLLHRNIIVNALASLVVILLGGLITWYFLSSKIKQESQEHLLAEKKAIEEQMHNGALPENFKNNIGDEIQIKTIAAVQNSGPRFQYIKLHEKYEGEKAEEEEEENAFEAMAVIFECAAGSKSYEVTIIRSADNEEELDENILMAVSISAVLMVLILALVNFFIYKKLWNPFYSVLREVQHFNISRNDPIRFPRTNIREFKDLNRALTLMEQKIVHDYIALKEFTENASHEIQTPLAVISSKIEMCLQEPHLSQQQVKCLVDASRAVATLSNLNKGLIILTKLDNKQFEAPELLSLHNLISQRLLLFEDFLKEKNISTDLNIEPAAKIPINPLLAETLFDNLLKNAIKHNMVNGTIRIEGNSESIRFSNTGKPPRVETEKLFERFWKDSAEESLGLGLALVKKICEVYGYAISYNFAGGLHVLHIHFGKEYGKE